jgi:serine O-acetyltransferase
VTPLRPADAPQPPVRERLRADLGRYFTMARASTRWRQARLVLGTEAIWAIATYRFGQYLREEASRPLQLALRLPYGLVSRSLQYLVGIHLTPATRIGPGLYIGHHGGVWISPHAELGAHCNVNHHVTIGVAGKGRRAPKIGDRVWIGPGATVSGPVSVGDDAVIGANSLVATDVPKQALALGVPARVMGFGGSRNLVG